MSFIHAVIDDDLDPGISQYARNAFLTQCRQAMVSTYGLAQPSAQRTSVGRVCAQHATSMFRRAPSSSLAYYTAAANAAENEAWDEFNRLFQQAWRTGRNEFWLVKYRVELADAVAGALDPASTDIHRSDVAAALATKAGKQFIAHRFVKRPEARDSTIVLVKLLPIGAQREFLRQVQILSRSSGPERP